MDKATIEKMIADAIAKDKKESQYSTNRTSTHTHNGQDGSRIDFGNLTNRQVIAISHIPNAEPSAAGNYGHFYHNPFNYNSAANLVTNNSGGMRILTITEVHGRAGNDAGAVTLNLSILNPGDASLSGGTVVTFFNLKSTADTPVYSAPVLGAKPTVLYPGQRLALQTVGVLTNVADVLVAVYMQY